MNVCLLILSFIAFSLGASAQQAAGPYFAVRGDDLYERDTPLAMRLELEEKGITLAGLKQEFESGYVLRAGHLKLGKNWICFAAGAWGTLYPDGDRSRQMTWGPRRSSMRISTRPAEDWPGFIMLAIHARQGVQGFVLSPSGEATTTGSYNGVSGGFNTTGAVRWENYNYTQFLSMSIRSRARGGLVVHSIGSYQSPNRNDMYESYAVCPWTMSSRAERR